MKKNIGKADRAFRIIVGVILVALGFIYDSWWGALGLIPLMTALIGWCPLYAPFRISTVKHN